MEHLDYEILEEYEEQALTPETQAQVEAHLASCPECQGLFERRRLFRSALTEQALPENSERFVAEVMNRIAPGEERQVPFSFLRFFRDWGLQGLATACSLLVIFSYSSSSQTNDISTLAFVSTDAEVLAYGYLDENFQLSRVLGFSNLEELQ